MMDNLDGKKLSDLKQWLCSNSRAHVLGVTERVKVNLQVGGRRSIKYYSTRLLVFREAVDLSADVPAEIEVCGMLDGRTLSMMWKCSVCQCVHEWHPDREIIEQLVITYLAE